MDKDVNKKSKKVIMIYSVLIILVIVAVILAIFSLMNSKKITYSISKSTEIEIVPTLVDEIYTNSAWCGTFQLVWNDMQNDLVQSDIVFSPQIQFATNLNKQTFTEDDISDEYYFKTYGLKTLDLKESIETGVQEKFDMESKIIDSIDWSEAPQSDDAYSNSDELQYIMYSMLYRNFTFAEEFDELENDSFTGSEQVYDNVEYFGLGENNSSDMRSQVEVLYYNSEDDLAVKINTNDGDCVVLAKGDNGNTFLDIYNNILDKSETYTGDSSLSANDTLKIPNIDIDIMKSYEELSISNAGTFYDYYRNLCWINQALQSIEFSLDKSGGTILSESVIDLTEFTMLEPVEITKRYFNFDSTFNLFLVEEGKDKPYLALNIDDITKFQ